MARVPTGTIVYFSGLEFNGTNQYAQYNAGLSPAPTDNLTIAFWTKVIAYGAGDSCFVCIGKSDSNGYRIQITSAGLLKATCSTVGNFSSGQTLTAGTWYHVALTRSGGTWQFYLNGAAVGSTAATVPFAPNGWALIGAAKNSLNAVSEYSNSVLHDVRYYNKVLTSDQINTLYIAASTVGQSTELGDFILWWKCREATGASITDYSGYSYTGVVVGPPISVESNAYSTYTLPRSTAGTRTTAGNRTVATI